MGRKEDIMKKNSMLHLITELSQASKALNQPEMVESDQVEKVILKSIPKLLRIYQREPLAFPELPDNEIGKMGLSLLYQAYLCWSMALGADDDHSPSEEDEDATKSQLLEESEFYLHAANGIFLGEALGAFWTRKVKEKHNQNQA